MCLLSMGLALVLAFRTDLGISAALRLSLAHSSFLGVRLLHAIEATNVGSPREFKAYRIEVSILEFDAIMDRGPREAAMAAAERYARAARQRGGPREMARAAAQGGRMRAGLGQCRAAVAQLDEAMAGRWSEPWAAPFCLDRLEWLRDGGDYDAAIETFGQFARWHAGSQWADSAVTEVWKAYQRAGRREAGLRALAALGSRYPGTPLQAAIARTVEAEAHSPPPPPIPSSPAPPGGSPASKASVAPAG